LYAALSFGYLHYSLDVLNQSFDEQYMNGAYNANLPTGEGLNINKGAADVGLGFMYHFAPENGKIQAFAGLSGFHINQPNLTLYKVNGRGVLPTRFNFEAGVKVIGNKMDFTPVLLYNLQGPFKQFVGGLLMAYKFSPKAGKLIIGAWYKENDAVAAQVGYEQKIFLINYSYDFGISQLARTTKGLMTHEITLGFKLADIAGKKGIKAPNFL
jgi:type IX secretion system PorP/SprF family membrane protein